MTLLECGSLFLLLFPSLAKTRVVWMRPYFYCQTNFADYMLELPFYTE